MHFGASQNSQHIWLLLKNQYDHYQGKSATQVRKLTFFTMFPHLSLIYKKIIYIKQNQHRLIGFFHFHSPFFPKRPCVSFFMIIFAS